MTRRGLAVQPPRLEPRPEPPAAGELLHARRLESPTALDRALRQRSTVDLPARATELQRAVDAAANDRASAALLAYELGELYETKLRDEERAIEAYRRAAGFDSELRCASWSLRRLLYRRGALPDVARVIDQELATAAGPERIDLLIERAAVADDKARECLDAVIAADPGNQIALLQLERVLARAGGEPLHAVWRRLAEIVRHPGRKLGYMLDLGWATRSGFDAAARVAGKRSAVKVAQEHVRCVAAGGSAAELDAAFEAYAKVIVDSLDRRAPNASALEREMVAVCWLRARHVRDERAVEAWEELQRALVVSHSDPLLVVELIELARAAGQEEEIPALVQLWKSTEDVAGRQATVSRWAALAFGDRERRSEWRALVQATNGAVPGWIVGAAVAECGVLAAPRDAAARRVLAERYLEAARAAARGTWLGAERGPIDRPAAAALYVQAAEVFASYLLEEDDLESAHAALDEARELVPDDPAVLEATIELEDSGGEPQEAIERLRAVATDEDTAPLMRALRIARTHGLIKVAFELERQLLERGFYTRLAWEHETTLVQLGRDDERAELLVKISRIEPEPQRKYMALLGAARLYTRLGSAETAIGLLRELLAIEPQHQFPREALIDALRRAQMWSELVVERAAELDNGSARPRAALREIAWVHEVCLGDNAAAAAAYAKWVERMPGDHAALEGLARCSALCGDTAGAVKAHEALAREGGTDVARWLLARSLVRSDQIERAVAEYRALTADGGEYVALTSALALVALATDQDDGTLRAFGTSEIASRTSDSRLAGALFEEVGWFYALTSGETERAATSFAEAVVRDPARTGALVGCTLAAAARADGGELARRYVELAAEVGADLAVALKLRAAAVALVEGDETFADDQVFSARAANADDEHAKFVMVETDVERQHTETDPFAATDRMVERAKLLASRAELVEDTAVRTAFELDRAEILEAAGQLREAAAIVTDVLRAFPHDQRALLAMRRLAREQDPDTFARASYVLATQTRDPRWKMELLADAATVFAAAGGSRDNVIATYDAICAIDPNAPEAGQLLAMLREKDDVRGQISLLTRQLSQAAAASPPDSARVIELLLQRVELMRRYDLKRATEDLDALLTFVPGHARALALRLELASDANDTEVVNALRRRANLATQPTATLRPLEPVPQRADTAVGRAGTRSDTTNVTRSQVGDDAGTGEFYAELTDPEAIKLDPNDLTVNSTLSGETPDPFASSTMRRDTSELQDEERSIAEAQRSDLSWQEVEAQLAHPTMTLLDADGIARLARQPIEDTGVTAVRAPVLDPAQLVVPPAVEPITTDGSEVVVMAVDQLPSDEVVQGGIEKLIDAYTREVALYSEPARRAALWTEIGRLCDRLGDWARAKTAYQTALAADPRWVRALRGCRRLAYRDRDMVEALALIEREVEIARGVERRSLQRFRVDLLLATREYAAARSAIDELLAHDAADVGAWFASLVAAYVEGDAVTIEKALGALAQAVPELAASMKLARAHIPQSSTDEVIASNEIDQHWQAIWHAFARDDIAVGVAAALELALHVEGEDPTMTTALAVFAQMSASKRGTLDASLHESALEAAKLSVRIASREPLVVRLAAETALLANDLPTAAHSLAQWARTKTDPAERAYAAARAAELEPTRLGRMWSAVVEHYPDDDYAVAKLRAHYVAAGKLDEAIAVDLRAAREGGRLASMIDAAETMVEETRVDEAVAALREARERWPGSLAAVEAQAETLASVGQWSARAKILDEAASVRGPAVAARDVLHLRAAAAWDLAASEPSGARSDQSTISALLACERVLADNPSSVFAHGTALKLARQVPDRRALASVLARLAAAESSTWAKASFALRQIRLLAPMDPTAAREIARTEVAVGDPRKVVCFAMAFDAPVAADVAAAHEARAEQCEAADRSVEAATYRARAAYVAAEAGENERALASCARFANVMPRVAADLAGVLGQERSEAGDVGFTRLVRDADDAARRGDEELAFSAYRRAIELRPSDPVALLGHALAGARFGKPVRAAADQLEAAKALKDSAAELAAYEHLARAAAGLGERASVIAALRSAVGLDPSRVDLYAWLERELAMEGDLATLVQLRREVSTRTAKWASTDRVAMLVDTALLSLRAGKEEDLVRACKAVLEIEPQHPFALRQLESALRRAGASPELAQLHERIASIVDRRSSAAALARAGDVYGAIGKHAEAAAAFSRAVAVEPHHVTALEGWRGSALDGSRWADLYEIARARDVAGTPSAAEFHLAGVALMDSATWRDHADEAVAALRRVLELEPGNADAFWRLWILFDRLGRRDELVELLRSRLAVASERDERIGLNRELAEQLFLIDPDAALQHYRAIVAADPTDVRAHAAIAELASAHAPWNIVVDAVAARIPLERDPRVLHGLYSRLGGLYAEHDAAKALEHYQRAAEHVADDPATLEQIARIATRLSAWPVALAASERLVVAEKDRAKLAEHLVRSATVFASGFSNVERATKMLLLALESAPTSTAALAALVDLLAKRDPAALRTELERVVANMRRMIEEDPTAGASYRMLSRASVARAAIAGSSALITARVAAEMSALFGAAEAGENALLARVPATSGTRLVHADVDQILVPETAPHDLLGLLRAGAPAIKKVLGSDLSAFGVQRKQRVRATDPVAVSVRAIAAPLGIGDVDVYLAPHPHMMIAEPGDPLSLVLGHELATSEAAIAHASGAALKLAQMSLAIPARLPAATLHALVLALLDVAGVNVGQGTAEIEALAARLRKQLPASARPELERHAWSLKIYEVPTLTRDLQATGLRAGFIASGQLRVGLDQLAGALGAEVVQVVSEPLARDLINFALGDNAATLLTSG